MPCTPQQTVEIATAIGNQGLVQLKANPPSLYERLTTTYPEPPPMDRPRRHEVGQQARIERCTTRVWPLRPGPGTELWHDHFCTLMEVHRHTDVFDTRRKGWIERQETAYYLSTVTLTAAQSAQIIRNHWGIENRLHYVRDVTLKEDASRIRRNPGIFALLRSFALNLLRFNGITNISLGLYDNALDFDRLLTYKGL